MGEDTVAELRVPDVDDAVKRVRALDVAGDDGERTDLAPADEEAAGNMGTIKARAVALIDDDRLLQAARLLRAHDVHVPIIDPRDAADVKLNAFIPKAAVMEELIESLKADPRRPGTEWIVQCEHSGRRDVSIYYRMDEETQTKLTARIESPIRKDMLVPFLSVLNESELYKSWLPNWTMPRLRVRRRVGRPRMQDDAFARRSRAWRRLRVQTRIPRRDPDDARERPGHDRDPREPRGALGDEAHRKTLGVDPRASSRGRSPRSRLVREVRGGRRGRVASHRDVRRGD